MAYVVGALFALLQGVIFWLLIAYLNSSGTEIPWSIAQIFFGGTFFFWLALLLVPPLVTMRSFSEEKRTGTIELLLTAPVSDTQVVVAKFLGAWLSYLCLWGSTAGLFLILRSFTPFDWGPVLTGYLIIALIGAVFVAIGVLASSLTRNQVIAAVLGMVGVVLLFSIAFLDGLIREPDARRWVSYFSLVDHVREFSRGTLDSRPVVFYATVIIPCLFFTARTIGSPRWRS